MCHSPAGVGRDRSGAKEPRRVRRREAGGRRWVRCKVIPPCNRVIQKYQTALGIQEPERSYTTGNSPPLVSALLAARPQRGVRPFSYVCTDTNQFLVPQLMFSSSAQRGPHAAECDLLKSLAPGLSSLSRFTCTTCECLHTGDTYLVSDVLTHYR